MMWIFIIIELRFLDLGLQLFHLNWLQSIMGDKKKIWFLTGVAEYDDDIILFLKIYFFTF